MAKAKEPKEKEPDGPYPQRFVHPDGGKAFPQNAEDAAALREAGFFACDEGAEFKPAKD